MNRCFLNFEWISFVLCECVGCVSVFSWLHVTCLHSYSPPFPFVLNSNEIHSGSRRRISKSKTRKKAARSFFLLFVPQKKRKMHFLRVYLTPTFFIASFHIYRSAAKTKLILTLQSTDIVYYIHAQTHPEQFWLLLLNFINIIVMIIIMGLIVSS